MKISATFIFLILLFLLVQPVVALAIKTNDTSCSSACCKKNESNKKDKQEKKDCNPFLSCSNAVWLLSPKLNVQALTKLFSNKKFLLVNDKRIIKNLSECFHPPNFIG